jgi:hypothetical protein
MGVVSGVVMPFQFGANWSRFSDVTANILSPLFAYKALTAFFLESAFLGVLLFGRKLVPRWAHFVAALMVAGGTLFSSFWILAANSWMQTPAGYEIIEGRFYPKSWTEIVFNPSFPYRLTHTVVGFYITAALVVVGVAAFYLRRGRFVVEARTMLSMTLWLLTALLHRRGPAVRLRLARCRLAGAENRRRTAAMGAQAWTPVSHRRAGGDRRRQRLDAADERRHRQPLVLVAQRRLPVARADRHSPGRLCRMARARQ